MVEFPIEPEFNALLWAATAVIALVPTIIFLRAYIAIRSQRLLLTGTAFLLVFVKAAALAASDFSDDPRWGMVAVMEIVIIGLIALALVRKGNGE